MTSNMYPRPASQELPMTKSLKRFTITPHGDGYLLHLETGDGETLDLAASFEQLDLIAEEIDRRLDADEDEMLPLGHVDD